MRPSGLEPPRRKFSTRPSTLRVYQFRHERRAGEYSPVSLPSDGPGNRRPLHPSTRGASLRTHVRSSATANPNREPKRHGSDQAPAGDLRLHPQVLGQVRLSAHGARHRQGRRARVLLDRARPPGQPREDRPAQARSFQAARDRAARPRGGHRRGERARDRARRQPAAAGLGGRGRADARGGEHRGLRLGAVGGRRRRRRSTCCRSAANR